MWSALKNHNFACGLRKYMAMIKRKALLYPYWEKDCGDNSDTRQSTCNNKQLLSCFFVFFFFFVTKKWKPQTNKHIICGFHLIRCQSWNRYKLTLNLYSVDSYAWAVHPGVPLQSVQKSMQILSFLNHYFRIRWVILVRVSPIDCRKLLSSAVELKGYRHITSIVIPVRDIW